MKAKDEHDQCCDSALDDYARVITASDIDNRICWDDYHISGDIEEIRKVARVIGRINIEVDDIIRTLSTTNMNYVTTGNGVGPKRILIALKQAIDRLPVEIQDIEKMIVNVWTGNSDCFPLKMTEIASMQDYLLDFLPELDLFWGVADDPTLNDGEVKITLIAVNKHKLC